MGLEAKISGEILSASVGCRFAKRSATMNCITVLTFSQIILNTKTCETVPYVTHHRYCWNSIETEESSLLLELD